MYYFYLVRILIFKAFSLGLNLDLFTLIDSWNEP